VPGRHASSEPLRWFVRLVAILWVTVVAHPALAGTLVVDVLDVGQGDAVLVRAGGKTALIDAGVRQGRVAEQLKRLGVTRLDLVVATHPHRDHVGGLVDVLEQLEVGLYLDNGMTHTTKTYQALMTVIEERELSYRTAKAGMTLRMGKEATFHVLFPEAKPLRGTRSDLNSNSVVLKLVHGEIDFLFTGDAEAPTEAALIASGLQEVEVLKVAHHGSAHSSTPAFLRATSPQIAVISCGADNRYGHPDPATVKRLQNTQAQVYRTDRSGHIRLISDGEQVEAMEGTLAEMIRMKFPTTQPETVVERR